MNEMLVQLWYAAWLIVLFFVAAFVTYVFAKVITFGVLMGRKNFLEYLIRKEEGRNGKS